MTGRTETGGKHAPFIFHLGRPDWSRQSIRRAGSARGARRSAGLGELCETSGVETTPFLAGRLTIRRGKLLSYLGRVGQRVRGAVGSTRSSVWSWGQCISVGPRPGGSGGGGVEGRDGLRGLDFGDGDRLVFWWLDKVSGAIVDSNGRVSYGGRVAKRRNNKVFLKFIAIKAWAGVRTGDKKKG